MVDAKFLAFSPPTVTVKAGQAVTWKFDDPGIEHNVTGAGLASPDRIDGYYTHIFARAGSYSYHCTLHHGMDGKVVVTRAGALTPTRPASQGRAIRA